MNRRQILKYAATLTGTAICAPLTSAMLAGCSEANKSGELINTATGKQPVFFKQDTFNLLTKIMDTILPKTDTPSASEVDVHFIMDNMLDKLFDQSYQKSFLAKFAKLQKHLEDAGYSDGTAEEQFNIIKALENTPNDQRTDVHLSYIDIKQQTVSYYLLTEEVAENHLNYLPIPGEWKPCVSVEELGGKKWAI